MKWEIIVLLIFLDSLKRDWKLELILLFLKIPNRTFQRSIGNSKGGNRIIGTRIVEVCRRIRRQHDFRTISAINRRGRLRPSSCWSRIANFPRDLHEYRLDAVWRRQTPMETVIIVSQIFESNRVLISVKLLDDPPIKLDG